MDEVEDVVHKLEVGNWHQIGQVVLGARKNLASLEVVRELHVVEVLEHVTQEMKGESYEPEHPRGELHGTNLGACPRRPQPGWKPHAR